MKKTLTALSLAFLLSGSAFAVPAHPGLMRIQQPDGSSMMIALRGDEYFHSAFTEDGYPIIKNEETGYYEYATISDGQLLASGIKASDVADRTEAARRLVQSLDQREMEKYMTTCAEQARLQRNAKAAVAKAPARALGDTRLRISDVPTTGSPKALVILVEFLDTKFSSHVGDAKEFYNDLLNKEDYSNDFGATGSALDFYKASSNGAYTPQFDVYGPVTVSQVESYYAGTSGQANVAMMVYEVTRKLDSEIDYSQYDTDGDGQVDNIYFFYAGKGQADTGTSGLIWPHNAWVSLSDFNIVRDGVTIDRYACSSELNGKTDVPLGIGTFVHEFGHVLGIPDLYDTDSQWTSGYTLGYWDTMCKGCYNNSQNTPPLYSSYERYALGWLDPTTLDAVSTSNHELKPLTDENAAFLLPVPNSEQEYFLLENRQQKGWDEYLPGHGLLVWHIDENQEAWKNNAANNGLNNPAGHNCVAIVPADGLSNLDTEAGDAFPGTGDVTSASFSSWAGKTVFGLSKVAEAGELVNFTLGTGTTDIKNHSFIGDSSSYATFNLAGQRVDDGFRGVVIQNGEKFVRK